MAVIVKYIVVRNGVEKMTFATKKEADAHDKMLDIADNLYDFLEKEKIKLDEQQMENISLLLAQKRDTILPILRGIRPVKKKTTASKSIAAASEKKKTAVKNPKTKNPGVKKK